ncbi:MAG: hypothetical protein WCS34_05660 [Bacteroidales bacterium]
MPNLKIKEVVSKKDFKKFLKLPDRLYKNDPHYVPNLRRDEKGIFTTTPLLDYCTLKMWIVEKTENNKSRVVGRIAGIINPKYNELYKLKRARFGWIEFEEDIEIARLLLDTAQEWAKSQGMTEIHGPLGYNTWFKQGMLVYGFDNIPPTNCIYNFPYYPLYLKQLGFSKETDWVQYKLPAQQGVSDKLKRINDMLLERYPLKIVDVRKLRKQPGALDLFFKNYNETFKNVHNFVPLTDKEIQTMGKHYIKMLKPELNCFVVDDEGTVAAYGICFPSLSKAFQKAKGRLFPFGWYHLWKGYNHYDVIDLMMVGTDPHWNRKGASAIFHYYLSESFKKQKIKYGITNPQIEDNTAVKVWDTYKSKELYMRRRCFIKRID